MLLAVALTAVGLVAVLTTTGAAGAAAAGSFELRWHGEPGEPLSGGNDGAMTSSGSDLVVALTDTEDGQVVALEVAANNTTWSFAFMSGTGDLRSGTYAGAVGEPGTAANGESPPPVLAVNSDGNECASAVGTFEILELLTADDEIQSFAVDFQLGCGGGAEPGGEPQLVAGLRFNSAVPFDNDRSITGTIRYLVGGAAAEARACANAVSSPANTRCVVADQYGRYELAGLGVDDYFVSFTAPEGQLHCFDAQSGCESATYLSLRQPIFVNSQIDASLDIGCAGEVATIMGTNSGETLTGTPGRDVIVGLGGDDVINGLGGDDVLCGGDGADTIAGGSGNDVINGGDDNDALWGQAGDDIIGGFRGDDKLRGGDDNDYLSGDQGDDDLNAGRGNDEAHGDSGDDTVRGSTGDDLVDGGDGIDYVNGNGGADQVYGGEGSDIFVAGGPRPDAIYGGAGNDTIKGLGGADEIYGGTGNDTILGGKQSDMVDGGTGVDDCNGGSGDFDESNRCETVKNFEQ